jgi:hypothetical protein
MGENDRWEAVISAATTSSSGEESFVSLLSAILFLAGVAAGELFAVPPDTPLTESSSVPLPKI